MKRTVKKTLARLGYYLYTARSLPAGTNLLNDLSRLCDAEAVRTVLDVGANIGQSAIPFSDKFPNATVYSFEPTRATYDRLAKNTERYPQIHPIHRAVGSSSRMAKLSLNQRSVLNSLVNSNSEPPKDSQSTEDVQVVTIDEFMSEYGIVKVDLLKIDTEGHELEVLVGARETLKRRAVTFVISEVSFDPTHERHTSFFSLHELLSELDYSVYAFYDLHHWSAAPTQLGYCNVLHTRL